MFRAFKILYVLFKYRLCESNFFTRLLSKLFPAISQCEKVSIQRRTSMALQELGPVFIKLGQFLSMCPGLIGDKYSGALSELSDNVAQSMSNDDMMLILNSEFAQDVSNIFESISIEPVSVGSIAHIYYAVTRKGENVALKVQTKNAEYLFNKDLRILSVLAKIMHRLFPSIQRLNLPNVISHFQRICVLELDFRFEAANASELKDNFKDRSGLYVPKIYWEYTTSKVMTSEWIDGVKLNEAPKEARKIVAVQLIEFFFHQAFFDGFFHADIHFGNLLLRSNGDIVFLDCGIMGRLDEETMIYIARVLAAFSMRDYEQVANIHFAAGYVDKKYDDFVVACRALGESLVGIKLADVSIKHLLGQLYQITSCYEMKTQNQLLLLQKATVMLEGMCELLEPNFNYWEEIDPLVQMWQKKFMNYRAISCRLLKRTYNSVMVIPEIMQKCNVILDDYSKKTRSSVNYFNAIVIFMLSVIIMLLLR